MKRTSSKTKIGKSLSKHDVAQLQRYANFTEAYADLSDDVKNYLRTRDEARYEYDIQKQLEKIDYLETHLETLTSQIEILEEKVKGIIVSKKIKKYNEKVHNCKSLVKDLPTNIDIFKNMFYDRISKIDNGSDPIGIKEKLLDELADELKHAGDELLKKLKVK